MREIKFRVWNKDDSLFVDNDMFTLSDMKYDDPHIFQQYIGLKDKNFKDIYEGDIIPLGHSKSVVAYNELDFGVPCFCLKVVNEEELYEPFSHKDDSPSLWYEVIGNIYENPELLK